MNTELTAATARATVESLKLPFSVFILFSAIINERLHTFLWRDDFIFIVFIENQAVEPRPSACFFLHLILNKNHYYCVFVAKKQYVNAIYFQMQQ